MLKKINRIRSRKDFSDIKLKGVMYHSPIFSLVVLKTEDQVKQFGMVISKKIDKRAVVRNKIRRLLSVSIQNNWEIFSHGIKAVFLIKKSIIGKNLEEISDEVAKVAVLIK